MNTIREKIKKNQPLACAFLRMPEPSSAEIMAVNGIDLIVIDWEHYQHNSETMVNIVLAAHPAGLALYCAHNVVQDPSWSIVRFRHYG